MGYSYSGKRALITGASSGMGRAFAEALAQRGMNLLLVARSEEKLDALGEYLAEQYRVEVYVLPLDLVDEEAIVHLQEETAGNHWAIDMLVNCAGSGNYGRFENIAASGHEQVLQLNVNALVGLCHAYIPLMLERGEGAVLNVSSIAAFQPSPYLSVYGASQAFVQSFTEALWAEYRSRGIRVLAVCPGSTETEFLHATGMAALGDRHIFSRKMSAEMVVQQALAALELRRAYVVNGRVNNWLSRASRMLPREWLARTTGVMLKPPGNK